MSKAQDNDQTTETVNQMVLLDIPEGRIHDVLAYVEKLREEEAEVAGYTLTKPTTAAGPISGTNCGYTTTGSLGQDFGCADSDTY